MAKCENCGAKCELILDLGNQIICNRFLKSEAALAREKKYPLKIVFCPSCFLVQQARILPTKLVFNDQFNYLSGTSSSVVSHFSYMADKLSKEFRLKKGDVVLDIGSSDGTFLKLVKKKGISVLGVEPTPKPAAIANKQGINTIVDEFENVAGKLARTKSGIKLVTAFSVTAHTATVHKFLEGIKVLLESNPSAAFVSRNPYLPDAISKTLYDTLYIEHARFYTVIAMQNLFAKHGLHIYDAEKLPYYGGSILVYASLNRRAKTKRLKAILREERKYTRFETYKEFSKKAQSKRAELMSILNKIKRQRKSIVGAGAPMKSSVLLNYCRIGPDMLDVLTETNELKIGTYSPSGIKVADERTYFKSHNPDYALILSWNIAREMINDLRAYGFKGKFIIPLPDPMTVGSAEEISK